MDHRRTQDSLKATTLNIGCGRDPWGDIRQDLAESQTGVSNRPNVIGNALRLPIRDRTIWETRCWHVLEHVRNWEALLGEIGRVSGRESIVQLRFPIDDGYKRDFLVSWSRSDIAGMRHAFVTRKNRAHVWIVDPELVCEKIAEFGFEMKAQKTKRALFLPLWILFPVWRRFIPRSLTGRGWAKTLQRLSGSFPQLDYEWVLEGKTPER